MDSMFNQHAKWLKAHAGHSVAPADRVAELSDLPRTCGARITNGFSPPGSRFHRSRREQESDVVRVYLPPDANTLLSVADHCLRSRNYVNVIVAGKQPEWQWLDMKAAIEHCTAGPAFGNGPATMKVQNPTSSWRALATFRRSKRLAAGRFSARTTSRN